VSDLECRYTIDVIAALSFQTRFGFLEQEKDVNNMISGIEFGQAYQTIIGQVPEWHAWLFDNEKLMRFVQWLVPSLPNPLNQIMEVGVPNSSNTPWIANLNLHS
jgi:hypothetical protein